MSFVLMLIVACITIPLIFLSIFWASQDNGDTVWLDEMLLPEDEKVTP